LEELTETCRLNSAISKDILQPLTADMPNFILLLMTAQHIANTYQIRTGTAPQPQIEQIDIDPEETLEFVMLTMMLSPENQLQVIAALSSQMMTENDYAIYLDDELLDELILEILASRDKKW
jgi:hypothetical protein